MKKAVQFGAGGIGRGFLAQLFTQSGYRVVFAEIIPEIIRSLNSRKSYPLRIAGGEPRDMMIKNVSAVSALEPERVASELGAADIIATAVGAGVLPKIAPLIAGGITGRAKKQAPPVNIIICENLMRAGTVLKKLVKNNLGREYHDYMEENIGFVETVVSRMIPVLTDEMRKKDPLFVMAEEYAVLPADEQAFKGGIPEIKGLLPTKNFPAFEERKLFIHNLAHAACAFAGAEKGLSFIWEAVGDEGVKPLLEAALGESALALEKKHGFTSREMEEHIQDLKKRFSNRALGDTVARVARDPVRKLGKRDRIIGAALNCLEQGIIPRGIAKTAALAIKYYDSGDESSLRLRKALEEEGLGYVLDEICGLQEEKSLKIIIRKEWERAARGIQEKPPAKRLLKNPGPEQNLRRRQ